MQRNFYVYPIFITSVFLISGCSLTKIACGLSGGGPTCGEPEFSEWNSFKSSFERQKVVLPDFPVTSVGIRCVIHEGADQITWPRLQVSFGKETFSLPGCEQTVWPGYLLAKTWQPGMKANVTWGLPIQGKYNIEYKEMEKTTPIKKYEKPGIVYVHFFKNDEVRIVVDSGWNPPESDKHPILKSATVAPPEDE